MGKEKLSKKQGRVHSSAFLPSKQERARCLQHLYYRKNFKVTPLHTAAFMDDRRFVVQLLDAGVNPNVRDTSNITPLHDAAMQGHIKIVATLLRAGARVNIQDSDGYTPLHYAASKDRVKIIKLLLHAGARVAIRDKENFIPYECAKEWGHTRAAQLLAAHTTIQTLEKLSKPRNVRCFPARKRFRWANHGYPQAQEDRITSLHKAAWDGDKEQVVALLSSDVDPNVQDNNGYVPLHDAVIQGHGKIVSILLQAGAHIDIQDKEFGYTPLHDAARQGYNTISKLLLDAGARRDLRSFEGHTPQECAENYKQYAAAQLLATYKA